MCSLRNINIKTNVILMINSVSSLKKVLIALPIMMVTIGTPQISGAVRESRPAGSKTTVRSHYDRQTNEISKARISPIERNGITARKVKSQEEASSPGIEGNWIITLGDYYYDIYSIGAYDVLYKATIEDGLVWFKDPTNYEYPFVALYDEGTGLLTFQRIMVETGYNDYGNFPTYLFQEPYIYNETSKKFDSQNFTAQYDAQKGLITFADNCGIEWNDYKDSEGTVYFVDAWAADLEKGVQERQNVEDDADWTFVGNATFMDGWILPALGIDQYDPANIYEVALQQSKDNSNIYRLVNPYKSGPAADYNSCTTDGYIVFDVTNPDHVLVNPEGVEAGFANSKLDLSKFYCYNTVVFYSNYYGIPTDAVVAVYGDAMPNTTYKDGVVSLSYIKGTTVQKFNDANFGDQDNPRGGLMWTTSDGETVDMSAAIYFPGKYGSVGNLIEDSHSEPEYYDVNGIRIDKPTSGLYIVKKGNNVRKVIL